MAETEHIEWNVPKPIKFPEPKFADTFDLVFNTATGNLEVGKTDFDGDISEEPETWIESVAFLAWNILLNYGMHLAILICAYSLFGIIFRKNYLQSVISWWKKYDGHLAVMEEMKTMLETDYDVKLWSEPAFCKKYLELYNAFRRFRSVTNRDHLGNSILDDPNRQDEAKHLYKYFDVDYVLHDRLIYAVNGIEEPMEKDKEEAD